MAEVNRLTLLIRNMKNWEKILLAFIGYMTGLLFVYFAITFLAPDIPVDIDMVYMMGFVAGTLFGFKINV